MKKLPYICVFSVILVALGLFSTGFAADYTADENGKYNIEITGLYPENDYAIVIIAGDYTEKELPEINEDNIIYINQAETDAKGTLKFEDFIPMTESVGTVLISGEREPVKEGLLLNDDGFGYIAGRLISYTPKGDGDEVIVPSKFTEIAEYAFTTAKSVKNIFLPSTITRIAVNAFEKGTSLFMSPKTDGEIKDYVADGVFTYIMGDYNGDKTVNKDDFDGILTHFAMEKGTENEIGPSFKKYFDLNFDGKVTLLDAAFLMYYLCGTISDFFI